MIFRQGAGHVGRTARPTRASCSTPASTTGSAFICGDAARRGSRPLCGRLGTDPPTRATSTWRRSRSATSPDPDGEADGQERRTPRPRTYTATHTGLAGFNVTLPATFTIGAGATRAAQRHVHEDDGGAERLRRRPDHAHRDDGHVVRIPVVIRPVPLAAPAEVSGNGGPINYNVKFGYTGAFTATAVALSRRPSTRTPSPTTRRTGRARSRHRTRRCSRWRFRRERRTSASSCSTRTSTPAPTSTCACSMLRTTLVGLSAGATSAEVINFSAGNGAFAAQNFTVVVQGFGRCRLVAVQAPHVAARHRQRREHDGHGSAAAMQGATGAINLTFSGLSPGTRYLGSVAYSGSPGMPNPTIVRVDTP